MLNFKMLTVFLYVNLYMYIISGDDKTKTELPNEYKEKCTDYFYDLKYPINKTEYCENRHCVSKCCSRNHIIYANRTMSLCKRVNETRHLTNKTLDYSNVNVYKTYIRDRIEISKKNLRDNFTFVLNYKLNTKGCSTGVTLAPDTHKYYILEDGSLIRERPNHYIRFPEQWTMENYCLEYVIRETDDGIIGPYIEFRHTIRNVNNIEKNEYTIPEFAIITALLVSCFFLIMVLVVYGALWELRNLVGLVLMAYVGNLTIAFLLRVTEHFGVVSGVITSNICKPMSVVLYYELLASFFWMNVMSFDIWWTFRGMLNYRPINRRGELFKFIWYTLYASGVPLLLTIVAAVIDYSDLSHMPDIFKPHFETCFYSSESAKEMKFYLHAPIAVLLTANWVFFMMTACNIWLISRNLNGFYADNIEYNKNQNRRFYLYLKLSLVMGVSWILEVVELPLQWLQMVATIYNALVGVAIFFIFVFKRKILLMLCKRFSMSNRFGDTWPRKSSLDSSPNQDRKKSSNLTFTDSSGP